MYLRTHLRGGLTGPAHNLLVMFLTFVAVCGFQDIKVAKADGFVQQRWVGAWGSDGPILTGDLNGDGKTDVFMWRDGDKSWTINLSTGSGFAQQRWTGAWGSDGPIHVGDLNGDGKSDAFMWRNSDKSWTVNLSTGSGFTQQRWTGAWGSDGPIQIGDLNGDGKTDVFMWRASDKSWTVNLANADPMPNTFSDMDGVPTAIENRLLGRFRPFYRFSMNKGEDENLRPADADWFVRHSELMDHHSETDTPLISNSKLKVKPSRILTDPPNGSSLVAANPNESNYFLNIDNAFRSGESDWGRIQADAIGLYGHVVPLHENPATPSVITSYKIEYWQFYAYDAVPGQAECWIVRGPAGGGSNSHEGDWVGVELVVDADQHTIRRVRHNIHSASVVFELKQGTPVDIGGGVLEYRGSGSGRPYRGYIDLNVSGPAGIDWAQNNLVRYFCNENGCTHPVVYIENGGHEAWPTEYWNWPVVASHGGDSSHAYLVAPPQNLGEIGRPTPGCSACELVVGFNGHWGACGSDPPDGPPLKGTWGKP